MTATAEPLAHAPNAALMIDFDNVTMGIRSDLQAQLKRLLDSEIIKGKVAVQRAYADWRRYPQYIVPLSEASIDLIFAPAFGSNKKNATDIRLAIDALELVFTRPEIGTFILLSGDSDFSSLVLKLKEYGKYIIGVGIRESSSDLLIQNCDEYYSYTEVTGLAKEGEVEHLRRDPWELVVQVVTQMKRDDDVMRSDRLKQVMQTVDPNFDEKDTGFNRFSKFVVEAAARGLLTLEKLDNGQYAVELGPNANVPPDEEVALSAAEPAVREPSARPRRRRTARRREGEPKEKPRQKQKTLTLGEAFELLRQSLMVLGAVGDEATDADEARAKMVELLGDDSDPVFERPRFQRLMRQAHDADVIELVKGEGHVYRLKLNPLSIPDSDVEEQPQGEPPAEPAGEADEEAEQKPAGGRTRRARSSSRKSTKGSKTTKKKTTKGRTRSSRSRSKQATEKTATEPEAPAARLQAPEVQAGEPTKPRNPRFRRGSRGAPRTRTASESGGTDEATAPEGGSRPASHRAPSSGARSLGVRSGSRRRPGAGARGEGAAADTPAREEPASGGGGQQAAAASSGAAAPPEESGEGGGLLRRMTAALSKVVKGTDSESGA